MGAPIPLFSSTGREESIELRDRDDDVPQREVRFNEAPLDEAPYRHLRNAAKIFGRVFEF